MDEHNAIQTETTTTESPSMADTIRDTYRDIQSREHAEPVTEPVKEISNEVKEPIKEEGKARDETGRFTKQAPVPETEKSEPAPETSERRNPRWNKAAIEALDKLPDGPEKEMIRQAAILRDKAFFEGVESYKQPAERWSKLEQSLGQDGINYLRSKANGDEVAGLKGLMGLEQWANSNPVEFIKWFAQNSRIDLSKFGAQGETENQPNGQIYQDPRVQQLSAQLQQIEQREMQRSQYEQSAKLQTVEQQLTEFQAEHDKEGYLDDWSESPSGLRPGAFSQKFVHFYKSGAANTYADAYAMAKAATPEIRNAEAAKLRAEAVDAERKLIATRDAKRAKSVNVNNRGSLPPTEPVGTMADTIRETYRRLHSG